MAMRATLKIFSHCQGQPLPRHPEDSTNWEQTPNAAATPTLSHQAATRH